MREQERSVRPGLARRADEPETPADVTLSDVPREVRAELRSLPQDLATIVGAHLLAAGELVDEDPALALGHAHAARRRASRLPIVREATAETAHAAGEWAEALTEFRALRRMTGSAEYLPVMADCERALGRPREALNLVVEGMKAGLDSNQQIELVLVEAGARTDLDQRPEALRVVRSALARRIGSRASRARLMYGYADLLEQDGEKTGALLWFRSAADNDTSGELDTEVRIAALEGRDPELPYDDDDLYHEEIDDDLDDEAGKLDDQGDNPDNGEAGCDGIDDDEGAEAVPVERDEAGQ